MITRTLERINHETGEVIETQNEIVRKENKEEYVRFFLRSIEGIVGAKLTGSEHNVLYMLQRYTINNSNLLLYNAAVRAQIAETLGLKNETVKKAVEKMVKAGIIQRPKRGMYYLNPIHFGRGDWKTIKRLRKEVVFEYDFESLEMRQINQTVASYENEDAIREAITDAEVETTVKQIDRKTTEIEHVVKKRKRPSLLGALKGQIGDVDAREIRREIHEARANENRDYNPPLFPGDEVETGEM